LPPSAQDSLTNRSLLRYLTRGTTGRLAIGVGAAEIAVYVQNGTLMAAIGADDSRHLLRRLRVEGQLTERRSRELAGLVDLSEPVFGTLLDEVPAATLDPILHDLFRDNLCRFLGSEGTPRYTSQAGIFVDNMQVSYEPVPLVERCAALWNQAMQLGLQTELCRGRLSPIEPLHKRIVSLLQKPLAVSALLGQLPVEPIAGRALLAVMRANQFVAVVHSTEEIGLTDEPTEMVEKEDEDDSQQPVTPIAAKAREAAPTSEGADPRSHWLRRTATTEEDLDAFADHDEDRGSAHKGTFSTQQHNLERVEVGEIAEEIEADEVPQARFSAPVLSDDEAFGKIQVANDVLVAVAATFDSEHGHGRGRAALQLLLEGCPARYAMLFLDLQASQDGAIPEREVLRNLHHRPNTEHRQLLNEGLVDLIERSLSLAADDLTDQAVDTMLERVAGYRLRMGL
jgi:hypothetical protein